MAGFLKVLFRNLMQGPSTDPFPLGETFTPQRLRGRVRVNPNLCMGCGVCRHSCTAGAIDIRQLEDGSGFKITVWQNACCLCASCRHYCPMGAISIDNDWHSAHAAEEKYDKVEQQIIRYEPCSHCGTLMRPLPLERIRALYADDSSLDPKLLRTLCPKCRQIEDAKRNSCKLPEAARKGAPANDDAVTPASAAPTA